MDNPWEDDPDLRQRLEDAAWRYAALIGSVHLDDATLVATESLIATVASTRQAPLTREGTILECEIPIRVDPPATLADLVLLARHLSAVVP